MTDILIRDVPEEDVRALDELARAQGITRADFLRRQLRVAARRTWSEVSHEDLARLAELAKHLDDPDVMEQAWS